MALKIRPVDPVWVALPDDAEVEFLLRPVLRREAEERAMSGFVWKKVGDELEPELDGGRISDRDWLRRYVVPKVIDWRGVQDEGGGPLAVTPENVELVLCSAEVINGEGSPEILATWILRECEALGAKIAAREEEGKGDS